VDNPFAKYAKPEEENPFLRFAPSQEEKKEEENPFLKYSAPAEETPVAKGKPVSTTPEPSPDEPISVGQYASDYGKLFAAPAIQGVADLPQGLLDASIAVPRAFASSVASGEAYERGPLIPMVLDKSVQLVRSLFGTSLSKQQEERLAGKIATDKFITEAKSLFELPRFFEYLSEEGKDVADKLRKSVSSRTKQKIEGSTPKGNFLEAAKTGDFSKLSFGDDPTLEGYAAHTVQVLGSLAPVIATAVITKGAPTPSAVVGGGMAGGEGAGEAREYVKSLSDGQLMEMSSYYANMRNAGVDEQKARKIISDRAAEQAAFLQGSVGALGGVFTAKLVTGKLDNYFTSNIRSRLGRIVALGGVGAAEEGTQEFLEGIAADVGIDKEVVKEIGEESFANLILGSLGGGAVGAGRGLVSPTPAGAKSKTKELDDAILKAEEEYKARQKAAPVTEETEEDEFEDVGTEGVEAKKAAKKKDPLEGIDEELIDEVRDYINTLPERISKAAVRDGEATETEPEAIKNLRNYALRLGLDPKKERDLGRLTKFLDRAIKKHDGPQPPSPEKVQEATAYLQGLNDGTVKDASGLLFRNLLKLAGKSTGLGIDLEGGKRNTENLLAALSKATGVDLGNYYSRIGAGTQVSERPTGTETPAGTTPPDDAGLGVSGTTTSTTPSGKTGDDTSLDADALINDLKNTWGKDTLPIGVGGYTARDKKLIQKVKLAKENGLISRVPREILEYVESISRPRPRRYQLQEDGSVAEVTTGPGKPLYLDESGAADPEQEVADIGSFYDKVVEAFKKVREEGATGTRAGLPTWGALSLDERQYFIDALGQEKAGVSPLSDRFKTALNNLAKYKSVKSGYAKRKGIRYDARMDAVAAYEIDREAESLARDVEFPSWSELTPEQQDAYIASAPLAATHERVIPAQLTKTGKPETRTIQGVSAEQSRKGFDAVEKLLPKRTEEKTDQAYVRAQQQIEEEELGLNAPFPSDIEEAIMEGRLKDVLQYLNLYARGVTTGPLYETIGGSTARAGKVSGKTTRGSVSAKELEARTKELNKAEQTLREAEEAYVQETDERNRLEKELEGAKGSKKAEIQEKLDELVSEQELKELDSEVEKLRANLKKASISINPIASAVNRLVAGVLEDALKGTKLVYLTDEQIKSTLAKNPNDFIAEYDPKINTFYVGRRGLNETAFLHESTHAATVSVLYKFLKISRLQSQIGQSNDPKDDIKAEVEIKRLKSELTPEQMRGASQIIYIYNKTKPILRGRFERAYQNAYEFVAFGVTDPKFALALQGIKVRPEAVVVKEGEQEVLIDPVIYTNFFQTQEDVKVQEEKTKRKVEGEVTVWQKFTQALANAIGLTNRFSKIIKNKVTPKEYFDEVRKQTAKEITEGLEEAQDQEGFLNFLDEVFTGPEGKPKKKQIYEEGMFEKIEQLEKNLKAAEQTYTDLIKETTLLEEELKKSIQGELLDYKKDPRYKEQKAREVAAARKAEEIRDQLVEMGAIEYSPRETKAEQRKRLSVSIEPGYLGNAYLELMGAFNDIIAPPPEAGITDFTKSLPIKLKKAKKAPKVQSPSYSENEGRKANRMKDARSTFASRAKAIYKTFKESPRDLWLDTVKKLQNTRVWVYDLQKTLERAGALHSTGPKQNNVATASTAAGAIGENIFQRRFYKLQQEVNEILKEMAEFYGKDVESVLARLQNYAIYLHDPERRKIKWLKEAPLTSVQAVADRESIIKEILKTKRKGFKDPAATSFIKGKAAQLEALVTANLDTKSKFADMNDDKDNTLGPESKDYIDNVFGAVYKADPLVQNGTVDKLFSKLRRIDSITRTLNREANFYSDPVANIVDWYNFKNYFSFKGKPDVGPKDYQLDPFAQAFSGELQDKQEAFDGRISDADNPIVNFFVEAVRASRRLGRHRAGLELTIKNNIDNYNKGELGFAGKFVKKVTFEQQFDKALSAQLQRGLKNIFVRNLDGSVDIYEIKDPKILEAIKKPIQQNNLIIETGLNIANYLTSLMGQYHTRYNPAFAPVDFIRNSLSYSGVLSAEFGPTTAAKLMSEIATMMIMEGAVHKTARYSLAYANGDTATLRSLEKDNPYYQDLKRYFEKGGRVAYMQALSYKDNMEGILKSVDKNGILVAKEGVDKILDAYLDMFELSTRIAAYRVIKDKYRADGKTEEEAEVEAAAKAKNLANFEQIGEWGRAGGALFMFYRPTATGAVRTIDALAPAFDLRSEKRVKQALRKRNRFGTPSLAEVNKIYTEYNKQRKNARITAGAAMGFGYLMYMLAYASAGDDEEGRNKVLTDDTSRWVRTMRFNTGIRIAGKDLVIQIPWGFGFGAFAAIGAQTAALSMGAQSFKKFFFNSLDAATESFVPVQVSKIDKVESPAQAFADTFTPSLVRPIFQFAMNVDSFGREIYAGRTGTLMDSYTANDSVPEIYRDVAKSLYNNFGVDVSPNTLYFAVNNYVDGIGRVTSFLYNWVNILRGDKGFDLKSDTLLLDAFFKTTSNYDARQFSSVEKKIEEMERKYKTAELDPDTFLIYAAKHPYDKQIIDFYNETVNGELKEIRTELNRLRTAKMPQRMREAEMRLLQKRQDMIKSSFISAIEYIKDVRPDEPIIKPSD